MKGSEWYAVRDFVFKNTKFYKKKEDFNADY